MTSKIYTAIMSPRQQGKSWGAGIDLGTIEARTYARMVDDRLAEYGIRKLSGTWHGVNTYWTTNKIMSVLFEKAQIVTDGSPVTWARLGLVEFASASGRALTATISNVWDTGHVSAIRWTRAMDKDAIVNAIAALSMLPDPVVIFRSFDKP